MGLEIDTERYKRGNAVALTLLGLSVAILAGVAVLYYIGKSKPEPVFTPRPADEENFSEEIKENPREGWKKYEDSTFDFSIEFPDGWVVATGTLSTGDPVISLYKATSTDTHMVYSHQDAVSHVSVYPHGIAAEGINAQMESSKVIIGVPAASAKDYILESGNSWATKVVFELYPESWNSSGFLFSRNKVQEEELKYMRGDTQIAQHEFDPFTGDHIVRVGFIDVQEREVEEEILRSFSFTDTDSEEQKEVISVEYPKDDDVVTSPLSVKGSIPGGWYFEDDDLMVWLETSDGSTVTEVSIVPNEGWNTQESLPFEVFLVFEELTATSGRLFIGRKGDDPAVSNHIIPVLFVEPTGNTPVDGQ